jgi:heavy metal translocating P-type ATPase
MGIASFAGAAPPVVAAVECAHCGLPVPPGQIDEGAARQFCCAGCRTVHAVIHEHGLERYYALRASAGGAGAPARSSGRSYAELDDPGFLSRACRPAAGGLLSTELYLEDAHCSACVWLVERLPRLLPGVVEVRLDLPHAQALVVWDPAAVPLSAVAARLDSLGYPPHPCRGLDARAMRRREDRAMLARIGLAGAVAGNVMVIAFALYGGMLDSMEPQFAALFRWASLVIALPAVIWGGGVFFKGAWAGLRAGTLGMDLPISLGLLAGFLDGAVNTARGGGEVYFDSVTVLIFLLLVGRYLERRQQRAAADATELAAALAPSRARLLEGAEAREVPLEALVPGALVEVRAGDLVPADGVIVSGRSSLDVSLLSGESRPIAVKEGDRVDAGTLNLAARLTARVERTGEETRVGRLMKLVEEHARRRAPIVQLADRISGYFVAAVLALAALTLALWLWLDPAHAIDHAVALLIVTCPCALGLATPLAVSAAVGQAARAGLLIKGADVLEKLSRPGRLWLDKTGTLTAGRAALVAWAGDETVKPLVAAAESHSAHPLARALVAAFKSSQTLPSGQDCAGKAGARTASIVTHGPSPDGLRGEPAPRTSEGSAPLRTLPSGQDCGGEGGAPTPPIAPGEGFSDGLSGGPAATDGIEIRETQGAGIEASVERRRLVVGSPDFVAARVGEIPATLRRSLDLFTADGLTPVVIAVDGTAVAAAGVGDPLRDDAAPALARMRALGWRLGLLSGDHPEVVSAVGRRLGLDPSECRGGVAPEEKLRLVAAGAAEGSVVMVGDGVNDAAALAAASVGIAVHGGAEAALAAAQVFVTLPGVARVAELLDGARRTMRVVKRNLAISLVYNVAGVSLAMAGLLNPLVAAVLMPVSSLTVIMSSYRTRTFRPRALTEPRP